MRGIELGCLDMQWQIRRPLRPNYKHTGQNDEGKTKGRRKVRG
jgi:hypothetical protein